MRTTHHVLVSLAGALAFGAAGALYCAGSETSWEAAAPVAMVTGSTRAPIDVSAARAMLTTEAVLRRAALRPAAAAAIDRHSRPSSLDRLASLLTSQSSDSDTLSRAVAWLAPRVDVRAGPLPDMIDMVARMPAASDAAAVSTAVAEAFVAELNDTALSARRRGAEQRSQRIDRAARALDDARDRAQALRATDPAPVASLAMMTTPALGADSSVDRLKREANDAATRLADAARVYGPRHPEMIRLGNEAQKAKTALDAVTRLAKTKIPAPRADASVAEGGPDPRALEIAAAEDEAARAQSAYDLEMSRNETERREARVLKPASAPATHSGPSGALVVAASSLAGFLLFGAGPGLAAVRPLRRRSAEDRAIARLRGNVFSPEQGRRALAGLGIGEEGSARRIAVAADSDTLARTGARALAMAALAAGWRPLLVSDARDARNDGRQRVANIDGRLFRIRALHTRYGSLDIASPAQAGAGEAHMLDIDRSHDLVIAPVDCSLREARPRRRIDAALRIAAATSDESAARICAALSLDDARFAGTVLVARQH